MRAKAFCLYVLLPEDESHDTPITLTLYQTNLGFMCLQYKSFENTVGKGEIARNEQFLLFPQCFPPIWRTFYHFH